MNSYKDKWTEVIAKSSDITEEEKDLGVELINDFCDHLEIYSKATKETLEQRRKYYETNIKSHQKLHQLLKHIFIRLYETFTAYEIEVDKNRISVAYHVLNVLNLRTCPYCNRSYTFTVYGKNKKQKNVRPQLDHFYDKANYPILAVSFYNLVPSCPVCNYTKHNDALHVNPYFDEFHGKFRVLEKKIEGIDRWNLQPISRDKLIGMDDWGEIGLYSTIDAEKEDMGVLGLNGLYPMHDDYVKEMMERIQAYNDCACDTMVSSFQGVGHSALQVREFMWGKDIANSRNNNHPLSKLTRDILEQAGVVSNSDME